MKNPIQKHNRSHPHTLTLSRAFLPLLLVTLILANCTASPTTSPIPTHSPIPTATPLPRTFTGSLAYPWVVRQCDLGPRITGTDANRKAGDMFIAELTALGWTVKEHPFTYKDTAARNILAWKGSGPAVLIGAHYDSRKSADQENPAQPVLGANDGASGAAVLLELARALDFEQTQRTVYLAFFDAEDNGRLDGWDWIVGSTTMAGQWGAAGELPLTAMVLVDMIGDADQQVYYERNSDATLSQTLWAIAGELGYGQRIVPEYRHSMLDDHIPFVQKGIPSVDMIDFDYPYWHTTQDTPDKVSAESLEAIGRTLEVWLENGQNRP